MSRTPTASAAAVGASPPIAGLIAVVGCDGTGKSTLTGDLLAHLRLRGPAERRYLGLVSGEMGEKIKHLPLVGVRLERHLARGAERAQDMRQKLPGTGTALIMYVLSLWRSAHLKRAVRLARQGVTVITDRYPQAEIPGFHYDGPGLGAHRGHTWLVRKLAACEQRLYEQMARARPALVIRLGIDADTARARKPDHAVAELRDKIAVMARLHFNGARIVDIDTRAPYREVLRAALQAIDSATGKLDRGATA